MSIKSVAWSWIWISLLTASLAGCGDASPPGEKGSSRDKVVAVGSQWYGHIPVWVGIERGIFERAGFDVHWRVIGKSMDRLNAISSGEAQFASLGEIAMLSAMAQGNTRFYWVGNSISLTVLLLDILFRTLERRLLPWQREGMR